STGEPRKSRPHNGTHRCGRSLSTVDRFGPVLGVKPQDMSLRATSVAHMTGIRPGKSPAIHGPAATRGGGNRSDAERAPRETRCMNSVQRIWRYLIDGPLV